MPVTYRQILIFLNNDAMKFSLLANQGTYILILNLPVVTRIRTGALGTLRFSKGIYAYVGSAFGPGGLRARLRHHLLLPAEPRWHIDYLRGHADIREIRFTTDRHRVECEWADVLAELSGSSQPAPGFGASDCHCLTHLFYLPGKPQINLFKQRIHVFKPKDFRFIK